MYDVQRMLQESVDEYIERVKKTELFISMKDEPEFGFYARLQEAIVQALYRLDAFPRSHPFWINTNHKATIHKLQEFSGIILEENPEDSPALWCLAALNVLYYSNDFGAKAWERLNKLESLDVRWPIYAAYHVSSMAGSPSLKLKGVLQKLQMLQLAQSFLESAEGTPSIKKWLVVQQQSIDGFLF